MMTTTDPNERQSAGTSVGEEASKWADAAKEQAGKAGKNLKESGKEAVERGAEQTASTVGSYREVISSAASGARDSNCSCMAEGLERVAESVGRVEDYFRSASPEILLRDMGDCVRDHKMVALPALFVGGMALGRFLEARPPAPARADRVDPS